jgi:phosphate transport system substrate-binding protein
MLRLIVKNMKRRKDVSGPVRHILSVACVFVLMLNLSLGSACSNVSDAGVIVAGSTSVQPYAEILAEEYMILHPDIVIDIQGGGSSAGIMAAQTGTSNLGMSSRVLKDEEKGLWYVEIARDGLAVVINPANPIITLTLDQISGIYSAGITNWSQLGGENAKIHVITREDGSGTRDAFVNLVMGEANITPTAIVQDSNGAVRQLVADDPNAIGFISLGLVDDTVKALELNGVAATRENVVNGSYNLSRPFLFVAQAEPTGETKQFLDFVLSAEGQKILMNEGLISPLESAGT